MTVKIIIEASDEIAERLVRALGEAIGRADYRPVPWQSVPEPAPDTERGKILAVIRRHGDEGVGWAEIWPSIRADDRGLSAHLTWLTRSGFVERIARGQYRAIRHDQKPVNGAEVGGIVAGWRTA